MNITPTLHIGAGTTVGPLTIFPVWTDAPLPLRAPRTTLPRAGSISELPEGAQVDQLLADNPTKNPVLLVGGCLFGGGLQHRTLIHSHLIPAGAQIRLDVRCVEQGRWHGDHGQKLTGRLAPLSVRGALRGIHRERAESPTDRRIRADQGEVWQRVQLYEASLGHSPSCSVIEMTSGLDDTAEEIYSAVRPLPGQRGVMIGIGGHPVLLEVFNHPRALEQMFDAIVSSVVGDAQLVPQRPTPGHRARTFAAAVSGRRLEQLTAVGDGAILEARDDLVSIETLATLADPEPVFPYQTASENLLHVSALNARHELVGAL